MTTIYINIVEITSGTKPQSIQLPHQLNTLNINQCIKDVVEKYKDHPSIKMIKDNNQKVIDFTLPSTTSEEINKIIKQLNVKKAAGPELILPNLVKRSADIIDKPWSKVINEIISNDIFPDQAKLAHVNPYFQKEGQIGQNQL